MNEIAERPEENATAEVTNAAEAGEENRLPLVEIGWVQVGRLLKDDRQALQKARQSFLAKLQKLFPGYRWQIYRVERRAVGERQRRRPDELLDIGADERDLHRWDFTFVVTDADLVTYRKPFALGAPSRALGAAVISTARLLTDVAEGKRTQEVSIKADRLTALALHLFGHLVFLDNQDDPEDFMHEFEHPSDLDRMRRFSRDDLPELREQLAEVADVRLEETDRFEGRVLGFYLRAAWLQRREIWTSMMRIEPWMFPLRLGRLTTAAASALVILTVTAESWELGTSQPLPRVITLALCTIVFLTFLLLRRLRLLLVQRSRQPSEQRVASNVAVGLAMLVGLTFLYAILFTATFGLAELLFTRELIASWAPSIGGVVTTRHVASFAGFVAFLGLIVGALGASFEDQDYFRHITLVDEET